jgi:hypothetical protein
MARELADRRDRLFGREGDLAHLLERARFKGLTAVVARPQMGKSWLLTELARRLAQEHEPPHLVGFAESFGETPDLLLRTVVDLYARWLSDAGFWQQARKVWENEKANLLPGVAKAVTKIFKETHPVTKPAAVAVEEAINGLVAADERLRTGALQLPMLSYEQARDLVASVARISGRPIALFLEQWEKSPDAPRESKTLDSFLHHLDDWPACHIFMALRPDDPAHREVKKLAKSLSGTAETYPLQEMHLGRNESHGLATFVRKLVPAAAALNDEELLRLIDGYPGVVYQWTSEYQSAHMHTLADLQKVAKDAQNNRFSDLEALLPDLDGDPRRLAIRLALLPPDDQTWPTLRNEWLGDLTEGLIDDLAHDKVLESRDPPGFGHAKRWEAARDWLLEHRRTAVRSETEGLIARLATPVRLATRVGGLDRVFLPHTAALRSLLSETREVGAGDAWTATCQAAATLFGDLSSVDETLVRGANQARSEALGAMAPLLAVGLYNALTAAEANHDMARRDALLDELRALAAAHPADAAVREPLARGLFNTLTYAKAEDDLAQRDALLDELRALAAAHLEDAAVREWLAMGLSNTLIDARAEDDLAQRDALLDELRAMAAAHPADAAVREPLARGLFNTLTHAKAEGDLVRRDALLDELRALAAAHPEDTAVRGQLASGLYNTLNAAKAEDDLARRDALLQELRALAAAHPADAAVREPLAMGLVNTLTHAKAEGDLARRDALLDELRALAAAHPEDAAVRDLARGLFNTLTHAKAEDDLARRDALLDELRALAAAHPEDAAVREPLARGLFNTLTYAKADDDLAQRDALLDELRALAAAHLEDAAVRENLAKGLAKTMIDASEEGQSDRWAELFEELRALAETHPEDGWVEQFRAAGMLE